ncbi:hypothetical protein SG34_004345 [Thalassomonas viridans]|uniref:DUF6908 domain-containing protein n=1 Tax=Thalassomonas viridans TaxID=137584 RepID=A0AAE9Z508_9GAMM|nr:hypothetical protein [Thalassomonas viridans]WDE06169.1 hypothetical protein SG34_004345 [Thalassomonas viridans]
MGNPAFCLPTRNIYQDNYQLAMELGIVPVSDNKASLTLKAVNCMDLHVMSIDMPDTGVHHKSVRARLMTHLFDVQGNIVKTPEMVILIDEANSIIEAYSLTRGENASTDMVYGEQCQTQLSELNWQNKFLNTWLKNLKARGYSVGRLTTYCWRYEPMPTGQGR